MNGQARTLADAAKAVQHAAGVSRAAGVDQAAAQGIEQHAARQAGTDPYPGGQTQEPGT